MHKKSNKASVQSTEALFCDRYKENPKKNDP